MGRAVLMIAFHFPPAAIGSGHLRTLGFARHLPVVGWNPIILSASSLAYSRTRPLESELIPQSCTVGRAFALDASRHFAIAGKYPAFLAQPDRWISWWPAAVLQGLRLIRRHQVRAIWSTYPIMTAHCIARTLSRITTLPWIADFRDPVSTSVEPGNPYSVASQHRWERRVLSSAARTVFTTPGALREYEARYPRVARQGRLTVIQNGYEESTFTTLQEAPPPQADRPLVMLHSGLLYPEGRDPRPFFQALARLKASACIDAKNLNVVLRASGFEPTYTQEIRRLHIDDIVTLAPLISNREALIEQAKADALLLFQGSKFDRQIPAKLYEYLRIGRPIFALVGAGGDTASLLREVGGVELAPPDDVGLIETRLREFIDALQRGSVPRSSPELVGKYSRRAGAVTLAKMLGELTD